MGGMRRLARGAVLIAVLMLALAPSWLGPAMGALARSFGALEHVCACGMVQGKCGCPACARIERQLHDERSSLLATLKATCDDDDHAVPSSAPPLCLPSGAMGPLASGSGVLQSDLVPGSLTPCAGVPPPTPPPRSLAL